MRTNRRPVETTVIYLEGSKAARPTGSFPESFEKLKFEPYLGLHTYR